MDEITIRTIGHDEVDDFVKVVVRAFHDQWVPEDAEADRLTAEPDRWFFASDGDEVVGTAAACSTELTVPGGSLPAPGITAVGVLPSHRRRGINTRLMSAILDQAAERDEPLAYLWASETPIYGRFGYGMASLVTLLEVPTDRSAFVPGVPITGRVRLLSKETALPLMRPAFDAVASMRPGMFAIDDRWWSTMWFDYSVNPPRMSVLPSGSMTWPTQRASPPTAPAGVGRTLCWYGASSVRIHRQGLRAPAASVAKPTTTSSSVSGMKKPACAIESPAFRSGMGVMGSSM
jgi:predicted N-acetyltransferase YhbS